MRVAEFFGVGDFLLGARNARQIPAFACVENRFQQKVIRANFGVDVPIGLEVDIKAIPNVDIAYIGKVVGKERLIEVLTTIAPRALIMESHVAKDISMPGFKCQEETYGANEFCLPQKVSKTFVILWNQNINFGQYFPFPDGLQAPSGKTCFLSSILDNDPDPKLSSTSVGKVYSPNQAICKFPKNYVHHYNVLVDDGFVRRFSVREAKLIMGFSEDFQVPVSATQAYKILGRATWPPAITAITKEFAEWA